MAFTDKKLLSARIKALYPNTNLSQQRMNEITDRLSKKLADDADETAIDAAVNDFNDYNPLSEIAKTDDKIRGLEKKKDPAPNDDPKPNDKIELPEDTPAWAKALLEQNHKLAEKVNGFEQQQTQKTVAERFTSDERVKNIPAFIRDKYIPSDASQIDQAIESLTTAFTGFAEEHKLNTLGKDNPGGAGGNPPTGAGKVDPDLVAFATKQSESVAK